jgi:hypothetical protein
MRVRSFGRSLDPPRRTRLTIGPSFVRAEGTTDRSTPMESAGIIWWYTGDLDAENPARGAREGSLSIVVASVAPAMPNGTLFDRGREPRAVQGECPTRCSRAANRPEELMRRGRFMQGIPLKSSSPCEASNIAP